MSNKEQHLNPQDLHSQPPDIKSPEIKRRDFLRDSIIAATGVAVAVAAGKSISGVAETKTVIEPDKKEGYRLTKHIADYYKSAAI